MNPMLRLVVGLVMLLVGGYMFLDAVHVNNFFTSNQTIFRVSGFHVTSGVVLVPLFVGIGILFFGSWTRVGLALIFGSLILLFVGMLFSVNLSMRSMSFFKLVSILTLIGGGAGLMLSILRKGV
ncbi:MAG: hypothetical protein MUC97_03505 [Bernardetiaceae bacterium]|jgi:hypothetical protein|nr:hypothetical protein [Bernardetiaceae bacterium]